MDFHHLVAAQRRYFESGATLDPAFRLEQLHRLGLLVAAREKALLAALREDLGKSAFEGYMTELGMVRQELGEAMRGVGKWSRPSRRRMPLAQFPSTGWVAPEPYGVALIMAPWNYPVQLTLNPLIAALAAGNCAVVKPSAYAPATSRALADLLSEAFAPEYVAVAQGGRLENAALLDEKFDTIFFTGSPEVGRVVMTAAAKHLTPVTLELGGKSPVIVDATADPRIAAKRILWGKTVNAGQTCVAPDYVIADRRIRPKLLDELCRARKTLWGDEPLARPDYPRIVNEKHYRRLRGLMAGEHLLCGGETRDDTLQIAPTILDRATPRSPVMQEEIFGPLLPVLACDDVDQAVRFIRSRPRPLALYLFTRDESCTRAVMRSVPFGGGCVNDTLVHLAAPGLPFGGVGDSGMGRYHGKYGFDAFSHYKGVLQKGWHPDIPLRYPPYNKPLGLIRKFMK